MRYWNYYPPHVTVAEKRVKAARKLEQLKKKTPDIQPILLEGRTIARTWWGKSWNLNLERYADYSNRIGRGRSYVRNGAVLDLRIDAGKVESLVQGTRPTPYSVSIQIKAVDKKVWQDIKECCEGKLESLQELLAGRFPKSLDQMFTARGNGLFPSPEEITFACSCPDWAYMCKHVAAALYGIGARLDEDPALFFRLRDVRMKDLITETLKDETQKLLKRAEKKTDRMIAESDLADVFGLEMDEPAAPKKKAARIPAKAPTRKKLPLASSAKTGTGSAAGKSVQGRARKKTKARAKARSPYDTVLGIVRKSRKGVTTAKIRERTGLDDTLIRNHLYKARRQGEIKILQRGVYISA